MTKIKDKLIADVVEYCRISGISESRFGVDVAKNNKLMERVRDGKLSMSTMQKIYDYIDSKK